MPIKIERVEVPVCSTCGRRLPWHVRLFGTALFYPGESLLFNGYVCRSCCLKIGLLQSVGRNIIEVPMHLLPLGICIFFSSRLAWSIYLFMFSLLIVCDYYSCDRKWKNLGLGFSILLFITSVIIVL